MYWNLKQIVIIYFVEYNILIGLWIIYKLIILTIPLPMCYIIANLVRAIETTRISMETK